MHIILLTPMLFIKLFWCIGKGRKLVYKTFILCVVSMHLSVTWLFWTCVCVCVSGCVCLCVCVCGWGSPEVGGFKNVRTPRFVKEGITTGINYPKEYVFQRFHCIPRLRKYLFNCLWVWTFSWTWTFCKISLRRNN